MINNKLEIVMIQIIGSLTFSSLMLPVCLLSGLAAVICLSGITITSIGENAKHLSLRQYASKLWEHYPVLLFVLWLFITCLWSPIPKRSLFLSFEILVIFLGTLLASSAIKGSAHDRLELILKTLTYSLLITILIFFCEVYFSGFLTKLYYIDINKTAFNFMLYKFDRGCTILSILSLIVIGYFLLHKKYFQSILLYCLTLTLLLFSDSLASLVAYICSFICLIIMLITKGRILPLFKYGIFLGAIIFIILMQNINPYELIDSFPILPDSAKHRIFIWNYVGDLALANINGGFGLDSSRYISHNIAESINYKNYTWSLLPLHPHNIILQILLELGIIGLLLGYFVINSLFSHISKIENLLLKSIALAIFIQYFIISMISYGIWQHWWVATIGIVYIYWTILNTRFNTKFNL